MALIDPEEINAQVAALVAQLNGSRARLSSALKNVKFQRDSTSTSIDQYVQNAAAAEAHFKEVETDAKIQPKLTEQSIAGAKANLEAAQANLKALKDSLDLMVQSTNPQAVVSAQAAYDQAKVQAENSERNVTRQKALLTKGYVAQQVVEQAETDCDVAEAHSRDVKLKLDQIEQTNKFQEANLKSQLANAESLVRMQESNLTQAEASVLPADKVQELRSARAALAQAKAQIAAARAGKTQDQMRLDDVAAAKADVSNWQNQLDNLQVQQHDTTLVASMAGVVTKKYSEVGELVTSAIASFGPGTPIFQIADLSTMLIKINVNEVDVSKLTTGMLTEVTTDSSRGALFIGKIRKVAPSAGGSDPAGSSTPAAGGVIRFPVEIQIDKEDSRLKPGMSARCTMIVSRRKNVLRLPTNCVKTEGGKSTVQIVTETVADGKKVQKVEARPVTIGLTGDEFVEIISGVKEDEKVRPNLYSGPPRKEIDLNMTAGN
jgi:HlyD family secretion protein